MEQQDRPQRPVEPPWGEGAPPWAGTRSARPAGPRPPRPYGADAPDRRGPRPPGAGPSGPRPYRTPPAALDGRRLPFRPAEELADDGHDLIHEGEELVAGRHPVEEAIAARRQARRLLVVPHRREALERIVLHATTLRIPIIEVEGGTLTAIAGFDGHQGVAIVVAARRFASLEDVLARAIERGEPPFILALDSLEDPQNLGSLLRSAEAAGVHGVLFPTRRQAPLTPAAIKASAGAVEHLLLVPVDDLAGALADLHVRGIRVAGAEADAALTHREADLRGPVVLVVGHEGQGLGPAVRRRCDLLVRIPMHGRIASLNAAVAGSILLFEAAGQRGEAPPPPVIVGERDELDETVDLPAEASAEPVPEPAAAPAPSRRKRASAEPVPEPAAAPAPSRRKRASAELGPEPAPGRARAARRRVAAIDVPEAAVEPAAVVVAAVVAATSPAAAPVKKSRRKAPPAAPAPATAVVASPAPATVKKPRKKAAAAETTAAPAATPRKSGRAAASAVVVTDGPETPVEPAPVAAVVASPAPATVKKPRKKAAAVAEREAPKKGRGKAPVVPPAAAARPDPDDDLLPGGPAMARPVPRPPKSPKPPKSPGRTRRR